ncbi:MAG: hypothetical protein JXA97_05290 [Anaerolineales bacterium]|nr:hypothetical protein [Anaerolineales bacterium]
MGARHSALQKLTAAVVLLWGAAVITGYYVVHKPLSQSGLGSFLYLLLTIAAWIGTAANTHALGLYLLPTSRRSSGMPAFALRMGLGFFVLSLIMLAAGLLGLYRSWLALILLVAPLPWTLPAWIGGLRTCIPQPQSSGAKALCVFLIIAVGSAVLLALTPPIAWDSLVYHLTGPHLYLEAGRIHHNLDIAYLGFPQAGSMLFLWGLLLTGPELAQLFHTTFMVLTLMLLPCLVRLVAPGKTWLAAALLIAIPSAWMLSGWAYVEWMTMFAGLASLVFIISPELEGRERLSAPAIAGLFAAFAFAAKYSTAGLLIGLVLAAWFCSRSWRNVRIFITAALAGSLPFLIKNWIFTGNPVYPFFFDGRFWDASRALWYSRFGTGLDIPFLLLAPIHASIGGIEGGEVVGFPAYGATIGPLLLTLFPLILLRRENTNPERRALTAVALVAGGGYLIWLLQMASSTLLIQTRLLMPVFPMFAILAVAGQHALERWPGWGRSAAFVLSGLMAMVFCVTAYEYLVCTAESAPLRVILGVETRDSYRLRKLGGYYIAIDEVNQLPDGSVIRFLWEPRSFDCREGVVCEPDALLDRWWHARRGGVTPEALQAEWQQEGVTHILLFDDGARAAQAAATDPFSQADWDALAFMTGNLLEPVWNDLEGYTLYALAP